MAKKRIGLLLSSLLLLGATPLLMSASDPLVDGPGELHFGPFVMTSFKFTPFSNTKMSINSLATIKSTDGKTYWLRFSNILKGNANGKDYTSSTTSLYVKVGPTTTADSIKIPFTTIAGANKLNVSINYEIKETGEKGNLFQDDIYCYGYGVNAYASESKTVSLNQFNISLRNGKLIATGLYFDFSYIRYDLLADLPYGKMPLSNYKFILRETINGKPVIFSSQYGIEMQLAIDDGNDKNQNYSNVFFDAREAGFTGTTGHATGFFLEQVYSRTSDFIKVKLKNKFYVREDLNNMLKEKAGVDYSAYREANDIYFGYYYQNEFKGVRDHFLYFQDKGTGFSIKYHMDYQFNEKTYKEATYGASVSANFTSFEKGMKFYILT